MAGLPVTFSSTLPAVLAVSMANAWRVVPPAAPPICRLPAVPVRVPP